MASTRRTPRGALALTGLCCSLLFMAFGTGPASARTLVTHSETGSFTVPAPLTENAENGLENIAVDEATGFIYTVDRIPVLRKWNPDGTPAAFSDPELAGATSIAPPFVTTFSEVFLGTEEVAVDNSGGPTQGRIYVNERKSDIIRAYEPSGKEVHGGFPLTRASFNPPQVGFEAIDVDANGHLWFDDFTGFGHIKEYSPDGTLIREIQRYRSDAMTIDPDGNIYLGSTGGLASKLDTNGIEQYKLGYLSDLDADRVSGELFAGGSVTTAGGDSSYVNQYDAAGNRVWRTPVGFVGPQQQRRVAFNAATNMLYVSDHNTVRIFSPAATVSLPDLATGSASDFEPTSVVVHGTVNPDGVPTTECKFEWGAEAFLPDHSISCLEGNVLTGSSTESVHTLITGLNQGVTYHYRLTVKNAQGEVVGRDGSFVPSAPPVSNGLYVNQVRATSALVHTTIVAGGAPTTYRVEYGPDACESNPCESQEGSAGSELGPKDQAIPLTGLKAGTTYHYRVVVENQSGSEVGVEDTFTTFPTQELIDDPCPNAHVRQQTSAALLLDCRAYELVSAADTGGYDVESDLSPGQTPLNGYPEASDRALYAVHSGGIPGVGKPTNRGPDPYMATRGEESWATQYVGIPSDNEAALTPFASSLLEASPTLDAFAFGGPDICSPCFSDGTTNVPLRLSNGELTQGMVGSIGEPAEPSGFVGKRFSADGKHFLFATTAHLEPLANATGTDTTVYERDLETGNTEVVSTLPDESTIANGYGVAALDVSADGSKVVVGERLGTDSAGNDYYRLFMHLAGQAESIPLTPGAVAGALYAGMSSDGSTVYFTTTDPLTTASDQDTDSSADIFRAEISGNAVTLTRVSTGAGAGDTDACDPPGFWNSVVGHKNCDALALGGGGGVAPESGTIYFISPEKLDTSGSVEPEFNQPNLYAEEVGAPPRFVATIDTSVGKPPKPAPTHAVGNESFLSGFTQPNSLAVDEATGDVYVADQPAGKVSRWTSNGAPHNFSALGTNVISGLPITQVRESQIAVDNSNSAFQGVFYVTAKNNSAVYVYESSGTKIGELTGAGQPCGVSVDPVNGDVYVEAAGTGAKITRYRPKNALIKPVTNTSYEALTGGKPETPGKVCNIDASSASTNKHIYGWSFKGGTFQRYSAIPFSGSFPTLKSEVEELSVIVQNAASDWRTGHLFTTEKADVFSSANEVRDRTSSLEPFQTVGAGVLSNTIGIAVDSKLERVYASTAGGKIVRFDPVPAPYSPIDHPLVVDSAQDPTLHRYEDFGLTPHGEFAVFSTKLALDQSYQNASHGEVYRYDNGAQSVSCVSCNPTNAIAEGDATLASSGLSLTDDGSVFFNSTEALAPRDLDKRQDAYEFENGDLQLISTGTSPFDSGMLGVSADGRDAFFFTRDSLVPQDENGSLVKLYDARAGGGFAYVPPPVACKASDECHGAGTNPPPAPDIHTLVGSTGNLPSEVAKPCKGHRVKRHGRCVKVKRHHRGTHRGGADKKRHRARPSRSRGNG